MKDNWGNDMAPKPPIRKQIHVKVGLMQTVKHTDALCINIRNAIERCDERVGGVEVTVVDVPMPVVFTGANFERG